MSVLREAQFAHANSLSYERSWNDAVAEMEEELDTIAGCLQYMSDAESRVLNEQNILLEDLEHHRIRLRSILRKIERNLDCGY
jgi:hypothetical protein